jgi:hypothetical protein
LPHSRWTICRRQPSYARGGFAWAVLVTLFAAFAQAHFEPIDLKGQLNTDREQIFNGQAYPTGAQTFGGVPFRLTDGKPYAWVATEGPNPRILEIPVNVFGVHDVHTLMSTYWGQPGPKSYASIEFIGTGDNAHRVDLIGGENIRDVWQSNRRPSSINGTTTVEVLNNGRGTHLDKQKFSLPARFHSDTLQKIKLTDNGGKEVQRLLLFGVTVDAEPAANSVKNLDAAYPVQGEYVVEPPSGEKQRRLGIQVSAIGNGSVRAVTFIGGLPGAGWTKAPRSADDAAVVNGVARFVRPANVITVREDRATITAPDDRILGYGSKVSRRSDTLGKDAPANATVLFDDSATHDFPDGALNDDGLLLAGAKSKSQFGNCRVHLEFLVPYLPTAPEDRQNSSGVLLQGRYEVRIADSFGTTESDKACAAISGVKAPDINMSYPPLSWQTYDIDFVAAKYDGRRKVANARITVLHNGVIVHDNVELTGATRGALSDEGPQPGPLSLLRQGEPVCFRNIWIAPFEADLDPNSRGDNLPSSGDFARFLLRQEKAAETARTRLLRAVDRRAAAIRKSALDPDVKRLRLEAIKRDRDAFVTESRLPSADELIDVVVAFIDDYQKLLDQCEGFRESQSDRAVRSGDDDAKRKLEDVELKLKGVIGGRESFVSGSKWHGQWQSPERAFEMVLRLDEMDGSAFRGELSQIGDFGRANVMKVEGQLTGNRIELHTTNMVRGKNRSFAFQGYLLSNRIIAAVAGITPENKPATGWLSLSRQ